jgi:hypothetical protein
VTKKVLVAAGFMLFLIAVAEVYLVEFAQANPIVSKQISPPDGVNPPTISVFSLQNNSAYASNNVSLVFNVSVTGSKIANHITYVYYKIDWHEGEIYVHSQNYSDPDRKQIKEFSCDELLTGIPEGNHTVSICVSAAGGYYEGSYYYYFYNRGTSLVNFNVDTTPPVVSSLSLENTTYDTSDIPLNFIVNEPASQFSYIVDGQENITTNGNTTLTGLSNGLHNVTVYAWDMAGNTGTSETIFFTIVKPEPEPFPTTMVIAPTASAAVIAVGLLVYLKKRKG